jgi:hypothetical protein
MAEADGERIRTISPDGTVSTLAGSGDIGFADGPALEARFQGPTDIALDAAGNVFVADMGSQSLRQIAADC